MPIPLFQASGITFTICSDCGCFRWYVFNALHSNLYDCMEINKWSMWLLLLSKSHCCCSVLQLATATAATAATVYVHMIIIVVAVMQNLKCRSSLQNYWHKFSQVSLSISISSCPLKKSWKKTRERTKCSMHWSANTLEIGGNGTCVNVCAEFCIIPKTCNFANDAREVNEHTWVEALSLLHRRTCCIEMCDFWFRKWIRGGGGWWAKARKTHLKLQARTPSTIHSMYNILWNVHQLSNRNNFMEDCKFGVRERN